MSELLRRAGRVCVLAVAVLALLAGDRAGQPPVPAAISESKPVAVLGPPYATRTSAWEAYASATDPVAKRAFYQIASTPTASWLGGSPGDAGQVAEIVADARRKNQVPQFVFYAMPGRDCGGLSAGGAASEADYEAWVRGVVGAIGDYPAIVIIEPDAIDFCGDDPAVRAVRTTLLRYVATQLRTRTPQVAAYLHVGAGELSLDGAVTALKESGIADLRGFALNVAALQSTATEQAYGDALVRRLREAGLGTKHYVVDTSRNGIGPRPNPGAPFTACNNPNVAIGTRPTSTTTSRYADAYLWVKMPGGSDGKCHPGDPGGGWFPQMARDLVRNAVAHGTIDYRRLPS